LRDEGLGAHDDQGLRRIQGASQILELSAIHVRHEMGRDIAAPLSSERFAYQQRSQVRAADADIHDMPELLAGDADLFAAAYRAGKGRQLAPRILDLCLDGG